MITFTTHQREILKIILDVNRPIGSVELAKRLHITPRQVNYSMKGVKIWLQEHDQDLDVLPGVGLLRTEFLFLERTTAPTEDEQFNVYNVIAETMKPLPVIVRTLDIGGDKPLPYIQLKPELNPFLGERGIRLCLNRPELFREAVPDQTQF